MILPNLTITLFIAYFLSTGTQLYVSDAQVMYESSRALAFERRIFLPEDFGLPQIRQNDDGRWVSQYDPGLPLIAASGVWLADRLAAVQWWNRYAFAAYTLTWVSALGAAVAVGGMAALWAEIDPQNSRRYALILGLAAGFCTPLWAYGRLFFAEGLLAGLLTLAFVAAWRGKSLMAGLLIGAAMLTRAAMVIYVPVLLGLLLTSLPLRDGLRFGVGPLLAMVGLGYHNLARFGDPLTFGYGGQGFTTPIYEGVAGLLFSSGKGVFFYAPPLLLSVIYFPRFYRRVPRLGAALVVSAAVALVFYGAWWAWHGGWCWGPRFLVPLVPLWMLPAGESLHTPTGRRAFFGLALVGFGVGFLGAFTNVNDTYAVQDVVHYGAGSPIWEAARRGTFEALGVLKLQAMGWTPAASLLAPIIGFAALITSLGWVVKDIFQYE